MESDLNHCVATTIPLPPCCYASNGGTERYALEVESSTGFVAFQIADGTILVSAAEQVFLPASPSVRFWPCATYEDTTPDGRIISFDCHGIGLTRLDVTALTGLEYLDCSFNLLTELSLAGLTELQALDAYNNQLASLDVQHLHALRVLNCANNRLTKLDLSGLDLIQILDRSGNPMKSLKIDGCTALQDVKGREQSSV